MADHLWKNRVTQFHTYYLHTMINSLRNKFAIDRNSSKASTTGITKEGIDI